MHQQNSTNTSCVSQMDMFHDVHHVPLFWSLRTTYFRLSTTIFTEPGFFPPGPFNAVAFHWLPLVCDWRSRYLRKHLGLSGRLYHARTARGTTSFCGFNELLIWSSEKRWGYFFCFMVCDGPFNHFEWFRPVGVWDIASLLGKHPMVSIKHVLASPSSAPIVSARQVAFDHIMAAPNSIYGQMTPNYAIFHPFSHKSWMIGYNFRVFYSYDQSLPVVAHKILQVAPQGVEAQYLASLHWALTQFSGPMPGGWLDEEMILEYVWKIWCTYYRTYF